MAKRITKIEKLIEEMQLGSIIMVTYYDGVPMGYNLQNGTRVATELFKEAYGAGLIKPCNDALFPGMTQSYVLR